MQIAGSAVVSEGSVLAVGRVAAATDVPSWAFRRDELPVPVPADLGADPDGAP